MESPTAAARQPPSAVGTTIHNHKALPQAITPTTTTTTQQPTQHKPKKTAFHGDSLSHSKNPRLRVNPDVIDELLLVCSVIGTHDETTGAFVPVTDCLQWLQDLQRALRRDDDGTRPISLLVGVWHVVGQTLLPLVTACRYDAPLQLTVCKILVILTKPLATATARAAVVPIDTKSKNKKTAPGYVAL
jgi:timeless